jgi:hypothetical protein
LNPSQPAVTNRLTDVGNCGIMSTAKYGRTRAKGLQMTAVENQILKNQLAIMWTLSHVPGVSMLSIKQEIKDTEEILGILDSPIHSHFKKGKITARKIK